MKAILYIGAVLMTGASVYGFVDYKKSNHKVSKLYETEQQDDKSLKTDAVITEIKKEVEKPVPPVRPEAPVKAKKPAATAKPAANPKTEIKMSKPDNAPVELEKPDESSKPAAVKENSNGKKIALAKKKKKVTHKMFSRAALDEKYLEKKEPESKTGNGAIKEQ